MLNVFQLKFELMPHVLSMIKSWFHFFLDVHELSLFAKTTITTFTIITCFTHTCSIISNLRRMIILNVKPLHTLILIADHLSLRSHDGVWIDDLNTFLSGASRHELSFEHNRALDGARLIY